ncbi:efflux RND transporter periplasmic adaptor subunit [Helicobacter felis]|uniref:efflux RND transporter periplasmic adaptor subunit n=1 Tax=Helicobacter felis TaxID=214 RepID=UPI000CF06175|nr:HlyD family efflux transporter periplasmic adaptor subunit [Helicobacter felis]
MKKALIFICALFLHAYEEIKLTPKEIASLNIQVIPLDQHLYSRGLPFNASIDFDNLNLKHAVVQSLSFNASVVAIYKSEGERVKKGDLICEITSIDLSNLYFELQNNQNKFKVALDVSAKDKQLYKKGVISKREYQTSHLASEELRLRVAQLENTFKSFGIDAKHPKGSYGFRIVARQGGILSIAPKMLGERIRAFTPFMRISENNDLVARISIPVDLSKYIKQGAVVLNKNAQPIGHVQSISVVLDKNSNTILATARIQGNYHVGEMVELFIEGARPANSLLIPSDALIKNDQDYLIFVRTPAGFLPTPVKVLEERSHAFLIQQGQIDPHGQIATGALVNLKGILNHFGED